MASFLLIVLVAFVGLSSVDSNITDYDCFERADPGPGRAFFEVYAWDARTKKCNKFIYGGLMGNRNRFETSEQCHQSCHDAVLRKQLNFHPARRYSAVNRLHEVFQIALKFEEVEQGYFKLITQPSGKVLSAAKKSNTLVMEEADFTGARTQLWDVIPTGEENYFRIKTATRPYGEIDYMFLQVTDHDTAHVTLARRDSADLGQQWQLI